MSNADFNKVELIGTAACMVETIENDQMVVDSGVFPLTVNRDEKTVDFHRIVLDFKGIDPADVIPFIKRGSRYLVVGKLVNKTHEDIYSGRRMYITQIEATRISEVTYKKSTPIFTKIYENFN